MSEHIRNLAKANTQPSDEDPAFNLADEIKKIQNHLAFLEKKLDILVAQSQAQPQGGGNRPPSREFRPRREFRPGGGGGGFNREHRGEGGGFKPREHGGGGFNRGPRGEGGGFNRAPRGEGGFKRREPGMGGGGGFNREPRGEGRPPFKKRSKHF